MRIRMVRMIRIKLENWKIEAQLPFDDDYLTSHLQFNKSFNFLIFESFVSTPIITVLMTPEFFW